MKFVHCRSVNRTRTPARSQEANIIDALSQIGKQVGNPHAALAVLLEFPSAGKQWGIAFCELTGRPAYTFGKRLALPFFERWFVIEKIDVTGPADHEHKDDGFGFGLKMRFFLGERVCRCYICPSLRFVLEQPRQGHTSQAGTGVERNSRRSRDGDRSIALELVGIDIFLRITVRG